jgi:hypothetical protein
MKFGKFGDFPYMTSVVMWRPHDNDDVDYHDGMSMVATSSTMVGLVVRW